MKVFISWSGETSRELAEAISDWLPRVLQVVVPFFKPEDIRKGARWNDVIPKELEKTDFGIICLTSENLQAPWIMFEAGALSKKLEKSHVCPILFGITTDQVLQPLAQFQSTLFVEKDIKRLAKDVNDLCGEQRLKDGLFEDAFSTYWPRLHATVTSILGRVKDSANVPPRHDRELLEEILELVRDMARSTTTSQEWIAEYRKRSLTEALNAALRPTDAGNTALWLLKLVKDLDTRKPDPHNPPAETNPDRGSH